MLVVVVLNVKLTSPIIDDFWFCAKWVKVLKLPSIFFQNDIQNKKNTPKYNQLHIYPHCHVVVRRSSHKCLWYSDTPHSARKSLGVASDAINSIYVTVNTVDCHLLTTESPDSSEHSSKNAESQLHSHISDCLTIRVTPFV